MVAKKFMKKMEKRAIPDIAGVFELLDKVMFPSQNVYFQVARTIPVSSWNMVNVINPCIWMTTMTEGRSDRLSCLIITQCCDWMYLIIKNGENHDIALTASVKPEQQSCLEKWRRTSFPLLTKCMIVMFSSNVKSVYMCSCVLASPKNVFFWVSWCFKNNLHWCSPLENRDPE